MDAFALPMDADPSRDPVVAYDEFGRPVRAGRLGTRYIQGAAPTQRNSLAGTPLSLDDVMATSGVARGAGQPRQTSQVPPANAPEPSWGPLGGLANILLEGFQAPGNALAGRPVTLGEVYGTAGVAALGGTAVPVPANALGSTALNRFPFYHGTPDGRAVRAAGGFTAKPGEPVFLSDARSVASTYADPRRAWDYQGAVPEVFTAKTSPQKVLDIDAGGSDFRGIDAEAVRRGLINAGIPEADVAERLATVLRSDGRISTNNLSKIVQGLGFDAADIANVRDTYNATAKAKKSTVRMMFNTDQIAIDGLSKAQN